MFSKFAGQNSTENSSQGMTKQGSRAMVRASFCQFGAASIFPFSKCFLTEFALLFLFHFMNRILLNDVVQDGSQDFKGLLFRMTLILGGLITRLPIGPVQSDRRDVVVYLRRPTETMNKMNFGKDFSEQLMQNKHKVSYVNYNTKK